MFARRITAPFLIALYVLAVFSPLALSVFVHRQKHESLLHNIGSSLGLVGFSLLLMHFVLASRLPWAERPFGLDLLYQFHRAMAILSLVLLLAHPLVLAASQHKWALLIGVHEHWYIWVGRAALVLLVAQSLLAVFRAAWNLEYERWKNIHRNFAAALLMGGFVHTWFAGGDLKSNEMRALWIVLFGAAAGAYLWHRAVHPAQLKRQPYRVSEVRQEAADVWTVSLAPKDGAALPEYLPGQYQYLTLLQDKMPVEEHPFTLSSSPSRPGTLSSTIKASGNFTQAIGGLCAGDEAWVDAPYGRFSYLLHPEEQDLVFIAGGVGVTPLISMLRHMSDTRASQRVVMLYANRTEADILFREELATMEQASADRVRVIHVLSKPGDDWTGEVGHLDKATIRQYCDEVVDKRYYICGPAGLIDAVARCLHDMDVPDQQIRFESFA